ncbi:transcription factor [Flagelloscypha sp. PMI_526]|nr:transcription factor [Flagelloscypha sp. PMI_526]
MDDPDMMAAMGFAGFGKAQKKKQLDPSRFDKSKRTEEDDDEDLRPPPSRVPHSTTISSSSTQATVKGPSLQPDSQREKEEEDSDSGFEDDDDELPGAVPAILEQEYDPSHEFPSDSIAPQFPVTHEMVLKDHTKVVSALALDPSGARVLSGSHDYDCKLWDFGGMDLRCKPFNSWEPAGSYHINDVKFSPDGQKFLVIPATLQPKLYGRDGEEIATFIKGDPYIRDMKHTAGHVTEITSCSWNPKDPKQFITSSADSTIRIWDVENKRTQKTVIVVKSKERGARTKINYCSYSPDGKIIGGACLDGALHMWNTNTNFVRPNLSIEGAHTKGTETGSIVFSVDGRTVLTRWMLTTHPDEKYIVTGAGSEAKGGKGRLMFLDRTTLENTKTLEVDATPVKVLWHSRINQIVAGLSNGQISVFYSPVSSQNGAKLLLNKGAPRKRTIEDMSDALAAPAIMVPGAGDGGTGLVGSKRKRDNGRNDPRKARRPELPVTGPGKGGRVGASATQHLVQHLVRDTTRDVDPREALLKYADSKPLWTAAWQESQPKPVFQEEEQEEKDSDEERG